MSRVNWLVNQVADVIRSQPSFLSVSFEETIVAKRAFNVNSSVWLGNFSLNPSPEAGVVEHVFAGCNTNFNPAFESVHTDRAVLDLILLD